MSFEDDAETLILVGFSFFLNFVLIFWKEQSISLGIITELFSL